MNHAKLITAVAISIVGWHVALGGQPRNSLDVYFIDVEGGQATLFVSPSGESMLMDAGNPGADDRDANRILSVARSAGLSQIDYFVASHFHLDHIGAVPAIAASMPIRHFLDYGTIVEEGGHLC
jgi:beta-lactamase superfamily II metal-dependent hydrolase